MAAGALLLLLAQGVLATAELKPAVVQRVQDFQHNVQKIAVQGKALDAKLKFAAAVAPEAVAAVRKLTENNFALPKRATAKFLGKESSKTEENCKCMNWQGAYGLLKMDGLGCAHESLIHESPERHVINEHHEYGRGPKANQKGSDHMCRTFFTRMNNNMCVNYKMEKNADDAAWESEQWCYVSSKCTQLAQGKHVKGSKLSWKMCDAADERTREMSVEELEVLAKADDIELGQLAKMAYPIWQSKSYEPLQKWKFAQFAWNLRDGRPHTHPSSIFTKDQQKVWQKEKRVFLELQQKEQPMVIPNDEYGSFGLVSGHRAYSITTALGDDADRAHPHSWSQIQCLSGCSPWGWKFSDHLVDENGEPFDKKFLKKSMKTKKKAHHHTE